MAIFDWLRLKKGTPKASAEGADIPPALKELERVFTEAFGYALSRSGQAVTPDRAMRVAAVYACVRVITDPIASLPLQVIRREGEKRIHAHDLPLYDLLYQRPNEWQTSMEWRELKQRDVLLRGNGYSLIVWGARGPVELIRLHPDRVQPKQDERTMEVTYDYTRPDGRRVTFRRREILHIRGLGDDGLRGQNPIHWFRETIGDAIATQEHGSRFWSNGAKPGAILQASKDVDIDKDARKELREDFDELYAGGEKAYRTAFLPPGVEFKQVSISQEDAQFLDTRKLQRTEIAGIFRVPPHKIGDLEKATFSNIEHQGLEYVTDTLTPWLVRWEQAIARDLLGGDPALYARFNVDALLRGDFKSRQEGLQIQRRNGVINANEWRELEDMNPRDDLGGAEYIVEGNMARQTGGLPPPAPPPAAK